MAILTTPLNTGTAGDSVTLLTKKGADLLARSQYQGLSFKITHFALGTGGFVGTNPLMPAPININDEALSAEIYRAPVDAFDEPLYSYDVNANMTVISFFNDGITIVGSNKFESSALSPSDVGRRLVLASGVDAGNYQIASFDLGTNKASVVSLTGRSVVFTADATGISGEVLSTDTELKLHRSSGTATYLPDLSVLEARAGTDLITNGTDHVTSATANFVVADEGRVIKLPQGINSGTYVVGTVVSPTEAVLTSLTGEAVSLAVYVPQAWTLMASAFSSTANFTLADMGRRLVIPPAVGQTFSISYVPASGKLALSNADGSTPVIASAVNQAWQILYTPNVVNVISERSPTERTIAVGCRVLPRSNVSNFIGELGLYATIMHVHDYFSGNDGSTLLSANGHFHTPSYTFTADDLGHTLALMSGPHAGFYKVALVASGDAYLTYPDGSPVAFTSLSNLPWRKIRRSNDGETIAGTATFRAFNARFTTADLGKAIKVGTESYLISSLISASDVSVITHSGSMPVFAGAVDLTWQIPDVMPGETFLFSITHMPVLTVFNSAMMLHRICFTL